MPFSQTTAQIAQVVKHETSPLHEELEKHLLPKLQAIRSAEDYARILQTFYGFFNPLEEKIQQHIFKTVLPDIEQRRTSALVLNDLKFLNQPFQQKFCTALPRITNTSEGFGAMYVLEGSTLGGKMIARMLEKNSAFQIPPEALNFFSSYKEQTGPMWTRFVDTLNQQEDVQTIVHAANQTFYYLKNWMQQELSYESKN